MAKGINSSSCKSTPGNCKQRHKIGQVASNLQLCHCVCLDPGDSESTRMPTTMPSVTSKPQLQKQKPSRFRGLVEDEDGNDFDALYTHYLKEIYTPVRFVVIALNNMQGSVLYTLHAKLITMFHTHCLPN